MYENEAANSCVHNTRSLLRNGNIAVLVLAGDRV